MNAVGRIGAVAALLALALVSVVLAFPQVQGVLRTPWAFAVGGLLAIGSAAAALSALVRLRMVSAVFHAGAVLVIVGGMLTARLAKTEAVTLWDAPSLPPDYRQIVVNGEPVSLHSVEFETYPNGMPKQYHTLLDFEEGIHELCVNHPLRHEGVTYYQMSYDRDPETGIQRTHLTLRSDPGARVVMIGYALLVLAAFGLALRETVR